MRDLPSDFSLVGDGGIGEMLGREVLSYDAAEKKVRMRFTLGEVFVNFQGVIHGGIIATVLDTLCGVAIRLSSDTEKFSGQFTLELKTSFLTAAAPGVFIGEGQVKRLGKSIAFAQSDLFDSDNNHIATASATFKLRQRANEDQTGRDR